MTSATFVLSSGRCGTQWLAKMLAEVYGDLIETVHEPLFIHYRPRELLGLDDPARSSNADAILRHFKNVEDCITRKPYLECGWPCYAAIPYLAAHLKDRIKIIHLTRHPTVVASSMMTHRCYAEPPRADRLTELALLTPFDAGVQFPAVRERWDNMDAFARCLYFWAEVNALGLRLEAGVQAPWIRVKFEELFAGDDLVRLLGFLNLPVRPAILEARAKRVDRHHLRSPDKWNVDTIADHPEVVEVAGRLGYELGGTDATAIAARYAEVRRNAPCPCGSGRKFKSCHGALSGENHTGA